MTSTSSLTPSSFAGVNCCSLYCWNALQTREGRESREREERRERERRTKGEERKRESEEGVSQGTSSGVTRGFALSSSPHNELGGTLLEKSVVCQEHTHVVEDLVELAGGRVEDEVRGDLDLCACVCVCGCVSVDMWSCVSEGRFDPFASLSALQAQTFSSSGISSS